MKIAIASDHGGFQLKAHLIEYLKNSSYQVLDLGPKNEEAVDYPIFARKVAMAIQLKRAKFGIIVCSSGVGVTITANRFIGVRAVNCDQEYIAKMSREHNNANVICFGQKIVTPVQAEALLNIFLNTEFSKEARHQQRSASIDDIKRLEDTEFEE